MSSQPRVQWNWGYIWGSCFNNFLHQFLEKSAQFERSCKYRRFVCLHCWLRRYDHISTNQCITTILKVHILFIGYLYYLLAHFHSCCFYVQYHDYLHTSIGILFYIIICPILLTQWRNIWLFYTTFVLAIQKRSRFEPASPPVHFL